LSTTAVGTFAPSGSVFTTYLTTSNTYDRDRLASVATIDRRDVTQAMTQYG
jgi:hypothetical protein